MKHSISPELPATVVSGEPILCLQEWQGDTGADGILLVEFELTRYWSDQSAVALTAIYRAHAGTLEIAVTDQSLVTTEDEPGAQFHSWVREHQLFAYSPGRPLPLMPKFIPKPWGQEIWYTGVEERGVCCFGDDACSVPIPWLQAVLPGSTAGAPTEALVLLKILDPLPEPIIGDLYFELHEEKREVYVVTQVDRKAWPGGIGYIRYGFDPHRLAQSDSEEAFRAEYLKAVQAYEVVRRQLDKLAPDSPPDPDLLVREDELRSAMNAYTHMRPLQVGDVVVVPLMMPHSLQHGVRTIEFQTPVYERKILSFAQEVLTQPHWDTADVLPQMRLAPPEETEFSRLQQSPGLLVERIVDFPDFEVRRIHLDSGAVFEFGDCSTYCLAIVVEGQMQAQGMTLSAERALLLPQAWGGQITSANPPQGLVFLLAMPLS